jgi:hypothetical protein
LGFRFRFSLSFHESDKGASQSAQVRGILADRSNPNLALAVMKRSTHFNLLSLTRVTARKAGQAARWDENSACYCVNAAVGMI